MSKLRVGIIRGGVSTEREVSLKTGSEIVANLNRDKYEVFDIVIDTEKEVYEKIKNLNLDFAYIALHGVFGEDGRIQAILQSFGIAYSGPGVMSSAVCMDKEFSKRIVSEYGVRIAKWKSVRIGETVDFETLKKELGNHLIVKPNNGGSSIGVSFVETEEELKNTQYAQPAIALFSVFLTKLLKEKGVNADYVAGHSLGEYSSLYAAGILEEKDTLKLISRRGKIMGNAEIEGSMAAILGLPSEEVEKICTEISGTVEAVNFNEPKQTVIAGEKEAIEKSLDVFKEKGAKRAIPLAVSGPFHSSLMKPVAEKLKKEFKNYSWNDAKVSLIANTTADILTSAEDIKEELYRQTFGPVKWVDTINKLAENGVTKIYEIGPGKVLAGLIKKINKNIEVINIENVEAINTLVI